MENIKNPSWVIYKNINGNEVSFTIADDGITYQPLYCGDGTEKDLDCFISWTELRELFIEKREANHV